MGWFFPVCCFAICFTPSLFIFRRLVAPDPLRIILFVLGAFFWLVSLLLAATVFAIFGEHLLLVAVFTSILFQETARALYFLLMYKAQSGLARLASDDGTSTVSGIRLVYSSRHILAIVCGLGMGIMAALFHLMNILAAYWDDGVVGFPAKLLENATTADKSVFRLEVSDAYFPLYYSLACALLTLLNVVWTICVWDAFHRWFHKIGSRTVWISSAALTVLSHFINTTTSLWLGVFPWAMLALQLVLFLCGLLHCYMLIKNASLGDVLASLPCRGRRRDATFTTNNRRRASSGNNRAQQPPPSQAAEGPS